MSVKHIVSELEYKPHNKSLRSSTKESEPVKVIQDTDRLRKENEQDFKSVVKSFGIDETFTKADVKQKQYNRYVNSVVPEQDFNYMADLIELPTTKEKFKWLLVCTDLATNLFDIEPMKNKSSKSTLEAFKAIEKRKILALPISLKTDAGSEFKGDFHEYLEDNKVFHKTATPYRKRQMAPVEGLNGVIGRLLMGYLNEKTMEFGEDYYEWTDILDDVREELNDYRERDLDKLREYQNQFTFDEEEAGEPEYKIGDYVYFMLDKGIDIQGKALSDDKHRYGDRIYSIQTRKIVDILMYPSKPWYRYKLKDMPHVSYSSYELKPAKVGKDTYIVRKIIDTKMWQKQRYYLVWWRGKVKANSTWELEDQLIEDNLQDYIDQFKEDQKRKKKGK